MTPITRFAQYLVTGLAVTFLAACSSTPNVYSNTAPGADLTQYSTFGFLPELSTDKGSYRSMESNFLSVAVAQEMDARGYEYAENPELLVNFYIHTEERIQTRQVPSTSGYYGWRDPFYGPWGGYGVGYETWVDQYTQGTLNIDVVDARSKTLLWEGAVTGRVTDSAIRNLEQTIDEAVSAIYEQFPGPQPIPLMPTASSSSPPSSQPPSSSPPSSGTVPDDELTHEEVDEMFRTSAPD